MRRIEPEPERNSTSEPNLVTAGDKIWTSGFPPGTTVADLHRYRRKGLPTGAKLHDTLRPEEGNFKDVKSEYQQRFINFHQLLGCSCSELHLTKEDLSPSRSSPPEDTLKLEGVHVNQSEYSESFTAHPLDSFLRRIKEKPRDSSDLIQPFTEADVDAVVSSVVGSAPSDPHLRQDGDELKTQETHGRVLRKSHPYRRPTTLRLEGEFYSVSEYASEYIRYVLTRRPELARKATPLKLAGAMDTKTEMQEQYVPLDYQPRPPLCKHSTNLHLDGELNTTTEKQDMYKPFEMGQAQRPPLSRHNSNLHLEGELQMLPEYRQEYVEHKSAERSKPVLPVNNLKADGFCDVPSDVSRPFEQQIHPQIPFLRGGIDDFGVVPRGSGRSTPRISVSRSDGHLNHLRHEEANTVAEARGKRRIQNNLALEGRIDMNPEYRNAYVDHYRDSRTLPTRGRSRRRDQQDNLRSEGKMDMNPEYSCSYVDFPRERPTLRRPEGSLSSEGEWDHQTEKNEKYVAHTNAARCEAAKREPELKLEGRFECQPEYRKAYIDYLIRERIERKPRPIDNLSRKAFALVDGAKSDDSQTGSDLPVPRRKHLLPTHAPGPTKASAQSLKPPQPPKPSSSSTSSVPSSPRLPKSKAKPPQSPSPRNRSLSKIETSVFGPKLTVPSPRYGGSRSSSRSNSPAPSKPPPRPPSRHVSPRARADSTSSDAREPRRRPRKFDSPVRVENLAYTHPASPSPPVIETSARRKWLRDESIDSNAAFVVLDREINNNDEDRHVRNLISSRESKWMPSWYGSQ